nr:Toll/interleukin-1 receptor (TIR) domain-containing protein [Tanacetum cinerariifolium]
MRFDHLYSALDQAEILTYRKEDTFPMDESFTTSHIKTIQESQIAIIIFPRMYVAYSWCLDELTYIMKCMFKRGKIVMCVLYGAQNRLKALRNGGGGDGMAKFRCSLKELERLKIPLQNIRLATNNFSEENRITRGGYGE